MGTQRHRLAGFVAFVVVAGLLTVAADRPVLRAAQATSPQRPPEPAELVEARAEEKEALDRLESVVRGSLWPASDAERAAAMTALKEPELPTSRASASWISKKFSPGPNRLRLVPSTRRDSDAGASLAVPGGPVVPVLVQLPPGYTPGKAWPLIWAMHGGPPSNPHRCVDRPNG